MRIRLIVTALVLLAFSSTGNASLEADCYIEGGYFDATYFATNYLNEACSPPGTTPDMKPSVTMNGVSIGI